TTNLLRRVPGLPVLQLVEDRVHGKRGLPGLPVAGDVLALTTPDRCQRVDGVVARLQRLLAHLADDDRGRLQCQRPGAYGLNDDQPVQRAAQRVHDPTEESVTDRDGKDLAGTVHRLAFFDTGEVTEDDDTDLPGFEVLRQPQRAVLEPQQLVGHGRLETLDVSDAVTGVDNAADLLAGSRRLERLYVSLDRVADLLRPDRQLRHGWSLLSSSNFRGWCTRGDDGSVGEPSPCLGEAVRDTSVDDLVPDLHDDAAKDARIHVDMEVNRLSVNPAECRGQPFRLLVGELLGNRDSCQQPFTPPRGLVDQPRQRLLQLPTTRVGHQVGH